MRVEHYASGAMETVDKYKQEMDGERVRCRW